MKSLLRSFFPVSLFLTGVAFFACVDKPNGPVELTSEDFPKPPFNLQANVGDARVELVWEIDASQNITSYKVFRQSESDSVLKFIASTKETRYEDVGVSNGIEYIYQVAAINSDNLQSELSQPAKGIPNLFSVLINNGAELTNSPAVTLNFIVPEGTTFFKLSNDPELNDAQWESFTSSRTWQLAGIDGVRTVYAIFRDEVGSVSFPPTKDDIVLDTQAIIFQVSENSNGRMVTSGEVIHFALDAQEPNGRAWVEIENGPTVSLLDDGRSGDSVANDGIYERDYSVPFEVQTNQASVVGRFIDVAGNEATPVSAPGLLTIQSSPRAVTLFAPSPGDISLNSIRLTWSINTDSDFAEYRIFRDVNADVNLGSTLAGVVFDNSSISFEDTELKENTEYFYKVYVFDTFGLSTPSNEISISTKSNAPPTPVVLFPPAPTAGTANALDLSWTQNTDGDFAQYRIFRARSSGVDSTDILVGAILDRSSTAFVDSTLTSGVTYYYRVFVFDEGGLSTGSNEEEVTIP